MAVHLAKNLLRNLSYEILLFSTLIGFFSLQPTLAARQPAYVKFSKPNLANFPAIGNVYNPSFVKLYSTLGGISANAFLEKFVGQCFVIGQDH